MNQKKTKITLQASFLRIIPPSFLGKNEKEVYHLLANNASLIAIAIRLLEVASTKQKSHSHLDGYSGELEEESKTLLITKIEDKEELKKIISKRLNK